MKEGVTLDVFYCNKLTIAKCLFNGHDGNYLKEKTKEKQSMVIEKYITENKASPAELKTSPQTILHLNLEPAHTQHMQPSKRS